MKLAHADGESPPIALRWANAVIVTMPQPVILFVLVAPVPIPLLRPTRLLLRQIIAWSICPLTAQQSPKVSALASDGRFRVMVPLGNME